MLLTEIKFIYCPLMYFDFMKHYTVKTLLFVLSLILSSPVYSDTIILGLNLEFIDSRFNDEGSMVVLAYMPVMSSKTGIAGILAGSSNT